MCLSTTAALNRVVRYQLSPVSTPMEAAAPATTTSFSFWSGGRFGLFPTQSLIFFIRHRRVYCLPRNRINPTSISSLASANLHPKPPIKIYQPDPTTPSSIAIDCNLDHADHFQEKMLYLASLGLDPFTIIHRHPPLASCSISHLKSTLQFLSSFNFTPPELRKIFDLNPEILTARVDDIAAVVNFLIREVPVQNSQLKTVLIRAPRLMSCSVSNLLRPTHAFLHSIGVSDLNRHPSLMSLLSYSVEDKLVPCIRYLETVGFEYRDVIHMVRRFPQLLRCDIEDNLEPKFEYLVNEMERERRELRDFPQYFAFSLENRIKRRHRICVEKSIRFPLGVMLKISEEEFLRRLKR